MKPETRDGQQVASGARGMGRRLFLLAYVARVALMPLGEALIAVAAWLRLRTLLRRRLAWGLRRAACLAASAAACWLSRLRCWRGRRRGRHRRTRTRCLGLLCAHAAAARAARMRAERLSSANAREIGGARARHLCAAFTQRRASRRMPLHAQIGARGGVRKSLPRRAHFCGAGSAARTEVLCALLLCNHRAGGR